MLQGADPIAALKGLELASEQHVTVSGNILVCTYLEVNPMKLKRAGAGGGARPAK